MSIEQAQMLSKIALGLFILTLLGILVGTLCKLSPKKLHWVVLIAFSSCLMMGAVTSMLYFWHHFLRH